jgi:hypothetical protein
LSYTYVSKVIFVQYVKAQITIKMNVPTLLPNSKLLAFRGEVVSIIVVDLTREAEEEEGGDSSRI